MPKCYRVTRKPVWPVTCTTTLTLLLTEEMMFLMPRERIHPEGADATYRVQASLKQLVEQGGARKTFRLKPEANKALKQLARLLDAQTETEAVETAIICLRDQLQSEVAAKTQRARKTLLRVVK
jgi:hypothetical protein